MYTDICGFSAMMEQDEPDTLEMLEYHNRLIEDLVEKHGGEVVKSIGDAYLADFRTTLDATRCAVDIQQRIAEYSASRISQKLRIRIGIHLGDIYFLENDALGEGINIASRLQSLCRPGRICVSQEVYNQIANKIDIQATPLGRVQLKNISREVRAYDIAAGGIAVDIDDETASTLDTGPPQATYDFEELKDIILDQVRQAGRRIDVDRLRRSLPVQGRAVDNVLDRLAEKGFLARIEKENGEISYGATDTEAVHMRRPHPPEPPFGKRHLRQKDSNTRRGAMRFDQYRSKIRKKARKAKKELLPHAIAFGAVNGLLFFLWMTTGAGFPWFLFPLCAWGIGLVTHIDTVKQAEEERRDVESMPELDTRSVKKLRSLHETNAAFRSHIVSNAAVSGFLFMTNLITSPRFLWALIPTAAMGLGVLFHWLSFSAKRRRLLKDLSGAVQERGGEAFPVRPGRPGTLRADSLSASKSDSPLVEQAEQCRASITAQLKELKKQHLPVTKDMEPLLDSYLHQIRDLSAKDSEIAGVIAGIPLADLRNDKARLELRKTSAQNDHMKREYQRSIDEIDRQMQSVQELNDHKEVIALRITSAVNSLKRLQLDLARMRSMASTERVPDTDLLKEKTNQLSDYLHDLQEAYREIDEDTRKEPD